jgi:hypothetical protein
MSQYEARGEWTRRCSWYPVKHRCGHYEARYMNSSTIAESSMPCTACDLLGRDCGIQPNYDTEEACLAACREKRP